MKLNLRVIILLICALTTGSPVFANGIDFSDSQGYFGVSHDNVGIGSFAPGQKLDVTGTIRTVGFTVSGQSPISGYVLTASDSAGDTTWSSAGGVSGWTVTGSNVYETAGGNVGIGTNLLTTAALTVMNGNVGIGTWVPGALLSLTGTTTSGYPLTSITGTATDSYAFNLNSTINTTSFNQKIGGLSISTKYTGDQPTEWDDLTIDNSAAGYGHSGSATIALKGQTGGTNLNMYIAGTFYGGYQQTEFFGAALYYTNILAFAQEPSGEISMIINSGGNVGIGTFVPLSRLNVNGGVGIGTTLTNSAYIGLNSAPSGGLIVQGNVGIGTFNPFGGGLIVLPSNTGNVGIGSLAPGQALDVQGTVRTVGLTMSGHAPITGYVLTASDSAGDTTWSSAGGVGGWTVTGNNVYETDNGNVGIGTSMVTTAALTVMNGNVGIGTWVPADAMELHVANSQNGFRIVDNPSKDGIYFEAYYPSIHLDSYWNGSSEIAFGSDYTGDITLDPLAGDLNFYTGNNPGSGAVVTFIERLAIKNNGNVGISTSSPGSLLSVLGGVSLGSYATLTAPPGGIIASGNVGIGTSSPSASLTVNGSSIFGYVNSSTDSITSNGTGSVAGGYSFHTGSGVGSITASSVGSLAFGVASSVGLTNASVISNANGSIALGEAVSSTLQSSGQGAIAMGFANGPGGLEATGQASVAIGQNVQATANDAFALGSNVVNPTANSFMVGFNATPTLTVTGTNVGIGTLNPFGGGLIVTNGNVGIGSLAPGKILDVTGTIRTTNFTMSGQAPIAGYVLTSSDSSGDTTWSNLGGVAGVSGWTVTVNNVYETNGGNVGIGTNLVTTSALTVMNGNVGIGTWVPAKTVDVTGDMRASGTITATFGSYLSGDPNGIYAIGTGFGNGSVNMENNELVFSPLSMINLYSGTASFENGNGVGTALNLNMPDGTSGTGGLTGFLVNRTGSGTGTGPKRIIDLQNQGTTLFMVDAVSGNVGIGTWAPGASLIVMGGNVGIGTNTTVARLTLPIGTTAANGINFGDAAADLYRSTGTTLTTDGAFTASGYIESDAQVIALGGFGENSPANTSYITGNLGLGTSTPQAQLAVIDGNVGIGTWTATGGALIVKGGNVGIGTTYPGKTLDVTGTVRTVGLTMSGQAPIAGYVLTSSDSAGDTTWSSPGGLSGWTVTGNNVYETFNGNVGIGTSLVTTSALTVMNGNVGIGTWVPGKQFDAVSTAIDAWAFETTGSDNALDIVARTAGHQASITFLDGTIADWQIGKQNNAAPSDFFIWSNQFSRNVLTVSGATGNMSLQQSGGNVGIGSLSPGESLDVQGSLRVLGGGSVGIGTSLVSASALTVMSGNVGIGTWVPAYNLDLVNGTARQRDVRRVNTEASGTVTINTDTTDLYTVTALAAAMTFNNPTGTPNNGDLLEIRILDNGTARALTWGTNFGSTSMILPTTTVVSTTIRVLLEYDSAQSKWECIGVA